LANKTVSGAYPPGSTFKMVTALAALEAGVVTPDTRVSCPGYIEFGGGGSTAGSARAMARSTWNAACRKL
jgi:cell division protein FtsI/penicillin-binding protein 2